MPTDSCKSAKTFETILHIQKKLKCKTMLLNIRRLF